MSDEPTQHVRGPRANGQPVCWICRAPGVTRRFALVVDGEPLNLQPLLCSSCGDVYLFQVGELLGELIRKARAVRDVVGDGLGVDDRGPRPPAPARVLSPEEYVRYIVEHADQIFVRDQLHGAWGSYSLAELPAPLALGHLLRFMAEDRMPVVVAEPPE